MFKKLLSLFRSDERNNVAALQKRVEQGDAEAMYLLGRIYHQGKKVEADCDKAMTLYHRANALGYPLAASYIGVLYDDLGEPEKSVEWFEQGIRQGDKRAQFNLGRFYLLGIAVEQDTAKALEMIEPIAETDGHPALLLGLLYDGVFDILIQPDYPKALAYYLLAQKNAKDISEELLATLYNNLGTLYNAHEDIPTDYQKAEKYLLKAAEMGLAHAMLNLGNLYGFNNEPKKAFKWYLKAAENDLSDAYYYVGIAYKDGNGVEQNSQKAVEWLAEAVKYGFEDAQWALVNIYRDGLGNVPKDLAKAEALLESLVKNQPQFSRTLAQIRSQIAVLNDFNALLEKAKNGDLAAQKDLAMAYLRGEAIEKDATEAVKWFRAAAEQGDADAQNSLYVRYYDGDGVEKNSEEAFKWLKLSAAQGHGLACYNLGLEYVSGELVEKNEQKAIEFFAKAAKKDIIEAYYQLGLLYTQGETIKPNYELARDYYELAGSELNGAAQNELGRLYFNGLGVTKDDAHAVVYFQLAAENGYPEGMYNLATMYDNGFGIKPNRKLAKQWFEKACEAGFEEACKILEK